QARDLGGAADVRGLAVLPAQLAAAGHGHAAGVPGAVGTDLVAARRAGVLRAAEARGGRVRGGVDRAVRRPQDRGTQAELLHRPRVPADRAGMGAGEGVSATGLALVGLEA